MLAQLARRAVEKKVKQQQEIEPQSVLKADSKWFQRRAATFVTLNEKGELRACIGTYLPTQDNMAREVVSNAIGAATRDHRFGPVQEQELPKLSYQVQVLSEPEPITGEDDLDPEQYGIVVKAVPPERQDVELNNKRTKTAVLLPDLEGIDSPQKQISVACRKARINPDQSQVKVWRFTTEQFSTN